MGLSQVLAKYDVVLVDQYGVLHNGTQPMIGALGAMGFSTDFQGVTAETWTTQHTRTLLGLAHDLGKLVSKTNLDSIFQSGREIVGLDKAQFLVVEGVQQVCYSDCVAEALATDYRHTNTPNDAINEFLRGGCERKLPLLCPNSDAVGVVENDRFVYMGGGIAKLYEEKGGEVVYFGKPTKEHFEVCLQLANVTDKSKVVHIGDSLHHDIQGATNVGVDSILIAGGVHAKQLEVDAWSDAEEDHHIKPELLDKLLGETELDPTYTRRFQW
ncbi:HAD-like domain [Phytophthora cactorum]|nr:HAD-like domain [Phytophthora cactorum]